MWGNVMLASKLLSYLKDNKGSFSVSSAVFVPVGFLTIGATIDWSSMVNESAELQRYADAAILTAAASGESDQRTLQTIAQSTVSSLSTDEIEADLSFIDMGQPGIRVTLNTTYDSAILRTFGRDMVKLTASADSILRGPSKYNIALVLDTTESMEGERLDTLKKASVDLVNHLSTTVRNPHDLRVSVVPFASYVRIDQSHQNSHWIDVQPPALRRWETLDFANSTGCVTVGTGELERQECSNPVFRENEEFISWQGCMGSRMDDLHKQPAFMGVPLQGPAARIECDGDNNIMQPLIQNPNFIENTINGLQADGKTYMPAGLTWGWRTLDPNEPFAETARDRSGEYKNIIILMSDGANTVSLNGRDTSEVPSYNGLYHWGHQSDPDRTKQSADSLTELLCGLIKQDDIEIITVAFDVDDSDTRDLLRRCASSDSQFFRADDNAALLASFRSIGAELNTVRLIR